MVIVEELNAGWAQFHNALPVSMEEHVIQQQENVTVCQDLLVRLVLRDYVQMGICAILMQDPIHILQAVLVVLAIWRVQEVPLNALRQPQPKEDVAMRPKIVDAIPVFVGQVRRVTVLQENVLEHARQTVPKIPAEVMTVKVNAHVTAATSVAPMARHVSVILQLAQAGAIFPMVAEERVDVGKVKFVKVIIVVALSYVLIQLNADPINVAEHARAQADKSVKMENV